MTRKPITMSHIYAPDHSSSLIGKRLCKAFASRSFWASVVSAYKIDQAIFYKIYFDDGDVDILSEEEVLADIAKVGQLRVNHFMNLLTSQCGRQNEVKSQTIHQQKTLATRFVNALSSRY